MAYALGYDRLVAAHPEVLATWSDQELITEWSKTTWDSGDPRMKAMSDEIERRNLDF